MGKKEQVPARAIFVQGSLWVWSAASRGRPPDGGLALAVFHMVPRVPAAPNRRGLPLALGSFFAPRARLRSLHVPCYLVSRHRAGGSYDEPEPLPL